MLKTVLICMALLLTCGKQAFPAQDAGSEQYYLVFIRPDPQRKPLEKAEGERIQAAHMANIESMAADGLLVAAGPFGDPPPTKISGIFVMKAPSLEEARRISAKDPTVVEHRNVLDVHVWHGPAAIGAEYFRLHKENPATPVGMEQRPFAMLFPGTGGKPETAVKQLLERLRESGRLAAAGPVEGSQDELRGVAVFRPGPLADARELLEKQPEVSSGVLRVEYHSWWCAAHVLPWEAAKPEAAK